MGDEIDVMIEGIFSDIDNYKNGKFTKEEFISAISEHLEETIEDRINYFENKIETLASLSSRV